MQDKSWQDALSQAGLSGGPRDETLAGVEERSGPCAAAQAYGATGCT